MTTKICLKCLQEKSTTDFHKKLGAKDGLQSRCKDCNNLSARQWQLDNPERFEAIWRKQMAAPERNLERRSLKYGISIDELKKLIEDSDGKCKVCKKPCKLVIDHCHKTDIVRGLLCSNCNTALGLFKDNIEALRNAIIYLEEFNQAPVTQRKSSALLMRES